MTRRSRISRARAAAATVAVAVATSLAVASPAAAEGVLIVGDSLDVGAGPYIRGELPGVPVTVDARVGRPSSEGLGVLQQQLSTSDGIVVFDLGTNDSPAATETLASNLEAARRLAGPQRCFVTSTLWRPPYAGVSIDRQNRVIQGFVERYPDVRVADWRAVARYYPHLFASDGVHASTVGYHLRAGLIARAIQGCPPSTQRPSTYQSPAGAAPLPQQPEPGLDLERLGLAKPFAAAGAIAAAASKIAAEAAGLLAARLAALP